MSKMEVVRGGSEISGIVKQSFQLLDRVQTALDCNKKYAMCLTIVALDINGVKSIVQQAENNIVLVANTIQQAMKAILGLAKKLNDLITKQENETRNGAGFCNFTHSFAKGPKEQKQLEQMRNELMQYNNTLILCIIVSLVPSGTRLEVKDVVFDREAIMQTGRVAPKARDFDDIVTTGAIVGDSSFINNSSVTTEHQERPLGATLQRQKIQMLLGLVQGAAVPYLIKQQITKVISQF